MQQSRRHTIEAESQKCTGCRRCQLICSLQHGKEFNLNNARIVIAEDDQGVYITFADSCDMCGICVQYCAYGALRLKRGT